MDDKKLLDAVNRSGFPLQIKAAAEIAKTQDRHGWRVLHQEHAWKNLRDGQSGFIDLVLLDRYETTALIVECKRSLDTNWIFLVPEINPMRHGRGKAWATHVVPPYVHSDALRELSFAPHTPESAFCVIDGQDPKARPMVERVAAEVASATEAYAREDYGLRDPSKSFTRIYANVILTTARLKLCAFDTHHISISTGTIADASFKEVPYLRFRKQLSTEPVLNGVPESRQDASTMAQAKENTVFVVNADHLLEFLSEFEVSDRSFNSLQRP
jgi:hypothetical protein